jgi:hypothetical protein
MKCLDDGYTFELDHVEGKGSELIGFHTKNDETYGEVNSNGTSNEEVLLMLIYRLTELNKGLGCIENEGAIQCLRMALGWLEERTINRKYRGVEGTDNP